MRCVWGHRFAWRSVVRDTEATTQPVATVTRSSVEPRCFVLPGALADTGASDIEHRSEVTRGLVLRSCGQFDATSSQYGDCLANMHLILNPPRTTATSTGGCRPGI